MGKSNSNKSIKKLMILSSFIFLVVCSFTLFLGRGTEQKSLGLTEYNCYCKNSYGSEFYYKTTYSVSACQQACIEHGYLYSRASLPVNKYTISNNCGGAVTVNVGQRISGCTITTTIRPSEARSEYGFAVHYTSSNSKVVKIDGNVPKAVGVGEATVTATLSDRNKKYNASTSYKVKVVQPATSISLSPSSSRIDMLITQSSKLTYTLSPSNATYKKISCTTFVPSGTSYDNSGKLDVKQCSNGVVIVYGSKRGFSTLRITVENEDGTKKQAEQLFYITDGNKIESLTINVPKSKNSSNKANEFDNTETVQLSATSKPESWAKNGVIWSITSGSNVATIDSKGKLTPKTNASGTVTVKVETVSGMAYTTKNITFKKANSVAPAPTKITLSATPGTTINYGGSVTISHTVTPSNADKTVKYTYAGISGQPVATTGSATIKNLPVGTHTIYAISTRDTSVKGTITITVIQPVTGVKIKENGYTISTKTIDKNGSFTLTAEVLPADATDKKIRWVSSDTTIATVTDGYVQAKKAGTVKITAMATNGKSASINLTVTNSGSSQPVVSPTGVTLSPTSATISVNDTKTLTATVSPSNASDKRVTWTSSDTKIATVENGVVTGKKVGTVTITAKTSNNKTATAKITVTSGSSSPIAVTGITVSPTSGTISINETISLTETISPSNATNKTVTWTSSDTKIATVNSSGVVTGKKAGTATITVKTSNNKTATAKITVTSSGSPEPQITSVKINPSSKTIDINEKLTLTATVTPDSIDDKSIEWSSNAPEIASVSSSGVVTGKKAGTAIITGMATNGKTGTARITVTSNISTTDIVDVDSITLVPSSRTINVGGKLSLLALINPINATDRTVTWTSTDPSVASVSSSGVVTGISGGTVTITGTTINGKESTSIITVNPAQVTPTPTPKPKPTPKPTISVTGVDVTPTSATIEIDGIISLSAIISPSNATNKGVKWSSSDSTIATVNSSGVVTGKSAGTVEITVTTNSGNKTATAYITVNKEVEIVVDPIPPENPETPEESEEPQIYEPTDIPEESGISSTILIIGVISLIIFIIGAVIYFLVKSRRENYV